MERKVLYFKPKAIPYNSVEEYAKGCEAFCKMMIVSWIGAAVIVAVIVFGVWYLFPHK